MQRENIIREIEVTQKSDYTENAIGNGQIIH